MRCLFRLVQASLDKLADHVGPAQPLRLGYGIELRCHVRRKPHAYAGSFAGCRASALFL
jgi:hypothetical protein